MRLAWHPHPDTWAVILFLALGYALAVRRASVPRRQVVLFALGVLSLEVAADWPVHDVAERSLYSVHMIQHLLISWVAVPLLLLGTPSWLFHRVFKRPVVWPALRVLSRPFPALIVFNLVLVLTHWPMVVNAAIEHHPIHLATHLALFGSALLMWMPVVSPVMDIPRLSYPGQMLFLFLQSLVPTVPASFLTFGSAPLYKVYESLPRFGGVSALTDQRVAGLIMKILGGFILWGIIAVLFFKWFTAEKTDGVDLLKWRDVQHDLNRMEPTP
jgi:putative membrane protein